MAASSLPQPVTGKRKRHVADNGARPRSAASLQIITGSYERVLHGLIATFDLADSSSDPQSPAVVFSDQFLFNAHASSIRCLALSPPSDASPGVDAKRILATGGTDERINLYSLSASAPPPPNPAKLASLLPIADSTGQPSRNRELGHMMHHSSTVSALHFPSRSKLLSASYDNTIAISRARDWTVLSTIRAPVPKPVGRPSGDTAAPGEVPAGINAVAVHPSAKLCLSVGQGERCMRLWNLVTGKKAGVLTFEKAILSLLGEANWRAGEGRSVVWSNSGEEFAVGFERGAVIYGLDCQVRGIARVTGTKVCQVKYAPQARLSPDPTAANETRDSAPTNILAMSTDDGRVVFFDTDAVDSVSGSGPLDKLLLTSLGQLGVMNRGNRIKDFQIFDHADATNNAESFPTAVAFVVVTGSSNGAICIWTVDASELVSATAQAPTQSVSRKQDLQHNMDSASNAENAAGPSEDKGNGIVKQVGTIIGTYQTGRRLTCLCGFFMDALQEAKVNGDEKIGNGDQHEDRDEQEDNDDGDGDEEEWQGFGSSGEDD